MIEGKNNEHDESVLNNMIFLFDHYLSSELVQDNHIPQQL